ncbi:Xanthotoxin 5-hydroxylase CYP82C4 [Citrus sinensis]|uniref:Xanthotoxin 5-hydroxylase CYP82C4 n=1 Tax=Citrus sinensis TaxID=2711 RepID=A0ACB8L1Z1_CITSI|nr:Xanthotoxin 5-hydroxylase CYP82C4 [Citrus sinensis]
MNNLSTESTVAAAISALVIFLSIFLLISRNGQKRTIKKKQAQRAPRAGGAWPLVGHLHLLGGPEPAHRVLGDMADKYGPIFTMKLGVKQALVVSNWEIAKECFTTNDKAFASRPKTMAMELLGYNFSVISFAPYGNYWRQSRKIAIIELLSSHRLEKLKHVRESEVKASIQRLYKSCISSSSSRKVVLVDMIHWLEGTVLDVVLRIIAGKRHNSQSQEVNDWQRQITKFTALTGQWLDIGGYERLMSKTAKYFDIILQEWLDEHKMKRVSGEVKGDEDFIYVLLSLLDDNAEQLPDRDADTVIKAICVTLIVAAADTTVVTLTWAIALLLNNRDVLKKAQDELDIQVGTKRQVNGSDMRNLVYLQAIIKETMRLYPALPLLLPHESIEECTVNGYHVPAGTQLFVNAWKIQRDPCVWEEPCQFQPERFLTTHKDIDVRGQNLELIPFGSGRRMCPAVSYGLQVMQLMLASLVHGFDFTTPSGEPVDMAETMGLTSAKATPLEVLVSPRLSASSYG